MLNIFTCYRAKEPNFQFQDKNIYSLALTKSLKFKSEVLAIRTLKRTGFPLHTHKEENAGFAPVLESDRIYLMTKS